MQVLKKFSINESTGTIIFNNGQSCECDPNTLEFTINNEEYVLFQYPTTLRYHKTLCDYTDELFYEYAIMPCKTADTFLEMVAGLCSPHITLPRVPQGNQKGLGEFIENIKVLSSYTDATSAPLQLLDHILEQLPIHLFDEFINFKKQTRTALLYVPETETRSGTMTLVCDFLVKYVSYDKSLLEYHSTTITSYTIYNALITYCVLPSIFHVDFPLDLLALTSHIVMSMFIDLLTDRWGTELIIKSGNTSLRTIYQDLKNKCQVLNLPSTTWNKSMLDKVEFELNDNYAINLYPYVLFYNLPEKERFIKTLTSYKEALRTESRDNSLETDKHKDMILAIYKSFNVEQIISLANEIILPLQKQKSLYTTESVIKLLESPIFQVMIPNIQNHDIEMGIN